MPAPRYHHRARQDLEDLWFYIAQDNPDAADRYLDELQKRARSHAANPNMGRLEPEVAKRLNLPSSLTLRSFLYRNHRAYYFPVDQTILILRVLDTRRDRDTALEE